MANSKAYDNFESLIKERSSKSAKPFSLSKTYPAYIVLIAMLVLSLFIYKNVKNQIENDINEKFDKSVNSIMSRLDNQYQNKYAIVKSMSGLYQMIDQVVRDYFDLYGTVPAKTYPSILSIEYIEKVKDIDLSTYTYFISSQGYSDYSFKSKVKKDVYYAIHHILPYPFNGDRLGIDMSAQPQFFAPAVKSVKDNKIVATESYVSRSNDTNSFFLIAPIFKKDAPQNTIEERNNNLKGFLALELNTKVYYEEALTGKTNDSEQSTFPSDSLVYFKIIDKNIDNNEYTVFQSANYSKIPSKFVPAKAKAVDYQIADKNLKIEFATVPNFGGNISETLPIATLSISLVLSLLFFAFVLSVTTSRARAVAIADKMTESQRRIVESSQDVIGVLDTQGQWLNANNASNAIFDICPENILKTSIFDRILVDNGLNDFFSNITNATKNINERITLKTKFKDTFKWVNLNITFDHNDKLIYVTGRDITLEKIAEEEAQLKAKQIKLAEMYALEASESKTYFMKKLSHQLRNSLTGIIGYLQLISNKIYDTEEELDQYVGMAEQSSEEIFNFVSDIVDATIQTGGESKFYLELVEVGKTLVNTFEKLKTNKGWNNNKIEISNESINTKAIADIGSLKIAFENCLTALAGDNNSIFTVEIQENPYEGATEIQILSSANEELIELINIYKQNFNNIANYLKYDKNDFLFKISNAASIIRRINGSFSIETLSLKDGNLITIQLPRNKQVD